MPCLSAPDPDPLPVSGARLSTLREKDLAQVLAIERASFANPWTHDHFRFEIRENRWAVNRIVELRDEVLAYACVWMIEDELKINNIAVHPAHRGRGLGGWLLRRLLDDARDKGCTVARLEVRPSNRAALRVYRDHGFREVGRRKGYYRKEREDAIVMEARL
jgi:ribosomal-protein-alanine N-acetyltransferase